MQFFSSLQAPIIGEFRSNLEDFRSHFRDFFARGRYVKFDDSCTVWLYFRDLRGAKKGPQNS